MKTKAFSFAHLLSRAGSRADGDQGDDGNNQDDERKQRDGESDDDYAKRMEELDKKEKDDGKGDPGAEDEDDDAAAADESDKEKAARASERARCAAIFGSKAAGGRPDLAAHLAFNTSMSAREAIGMLGAFAAGSAAAPAAPQKSLASRMAGVPDQNVGASGAAGPANSPQGAAAMILAAGKKRRGEA